MFPSTSSRETLRLSGKQNKLFPSEEDITAICKLPLGVRFFSCLFTFQTFRFWPENVNVLSKPINVCHDLSKVSLNTPPNVDWLAQNVNVFRSKPERLKRKQTWKNRTPNGSLQIAVSVYYSDCFKQLEAHCNRSGISLKTHSRVYKPQPFLACYNLMTHRFNPIVTKPITYFHY
jgi:hypothetical protein